MSLFCGRHSVSEHNRPKETLYSLIPTSWLSENWSVICLSSWAGVWEMLVWMKACIKSERTKLFEQCYEGWHLEKIPKKIHFFNKHQQNHWSQYNYTKLTFLVVLALLVVLSLYTLWNNRLVLLCECDVKCVCGFWGLWFILSFSVGFSGGGLSKLHKTVTKLVLCVAKLHY